MKQFNLIQIIIDNYGYRFMIYGIIISLIVSLFTFINSCKYLSDKKNNDIIDH